MKKSKEDRLVELLASVASSHSGSGCFYKRLDKDGAEFVDACRAVIAKGRLVSAEKVSEKLASVFKFQIGESAVRRHLKGACQCVTKS